MKNEKNVDNSKNKLKKLKTPKIAKLVLGKEEVIVNKNKNKIHKI
jgi:CO dehydrogenase/acetyl-CoA synthase gamma subunit (corrinoid Fe-S protein)